MSVSAAQIIELEELEAEATRLSGERHLAESVPRRIEEAKSRITHLEAVAEFDRQQEAFVPPEPDSKLCAWGLHKMKDTRDPRYVKGTHLRCTRCGQHGYDNGG